MKGIDNQDPIDQIIHKGIDNQGPIDQTIHKGIDNQGPTDQNNNIIGINNQDPIKGTQKDTNIINQIQSTPIDPNKNAIQPSFGGCSQCGMTHPPIPPGEVCPNASMESQVSGTIKITDQEFNKFLVDMKNILVSQLNNIKVTNSKEVFQAIILKVMEGIDELKNK